jgi:hypothetical protein
MLRSKLITRDCRSRLADCQHEVAGGSGPARFTVRIPKIAVSAARADDNDCRRAPAHARPAVDYFSSPLRRSLARLSVLAVRAGASDRSDLLSGKIPSISVCGSATCAVDTGPRPPKFSNRRVLAITSSVQLFKQKGQASWEAQRL